MPKRNIEFFIIDMLVAMNTIQRKTNTAETPEELLQDEDAWFIVTRQLEIIGEAMRQILATLPSTDKGPSHWRKTLLI